MCALVTGVQTCARPISMNALDLAFTSASIAKAGNSDAAPLTVTVDAAAQTVTFTPPKALAPGKSRLTTDSTGIINTQANGLFAAGYPDTETGEPRLAMFAQVTEHAARRLGPNRAA